MFGTECFILMAEFDRYGEALWAGSSTRCFSAVLEFQAASRSIFGPVSSFQVANRKDEIVVRHGVCKESLLSQVWWL